MALITVPETPPKHCYPDLVISKKKYFLKILQGKCLLFLCQVSTLNTHTIHTQAKGHTLCFKLVKQAHVLLLKPSTEIKDSDALGFASSVLSTSPMNKERILCTIQYPIF